MKSRPTFDLHPFEEYLEAQAYQYTTIAAYSGAVRRVLKALPHPEAGSDPDVLREAIGRASNTASGRAVCSSAWRQWEEFRGLDPADLGTRRTCSPAVHALVTELLRQGIKWAQLADLRWSDLNIGARYGEVTLPAGKKAVIPVELLAPVARQVSETSEPLGHWALCADVPGERLSRQLLHSRFRAFRP